MSTCPCPRIDGYVIHHTECQHRPVRPPIADVEPVRPERDPEADNLACAWADYRKDYGVSAEQMSDAHKAFAAGWLAARQGDQSGVLR